MILAELGKGGFGTVYRALDQALNREVALKVLNSYATESAEDLKLLLRESRLLAKLSHPNIVSIFAVELLDARSLAVSMELLEGVSLQNFLQDRRLDMVTCESIFKQICMGLAYAHQHGVIHRDLSSSNIFLIPSTNGYEVKIIDFGLSKMINQEIQNSSKTMATLTATGLLVGNPKYMSPEACRGEKVDSSSDIYALGCVLYEMLSGHGVFHNVEPIGLLYKHQHEYPPAPDVTWTDERQNKIFKGLTLLCIQKDKSKRPGSAECVLELIKNETLLEKKVRLADKWQSNFHQSRSLILAPRVLVALGTVAIVIACLIVSVIYKAKSLSKVERVAFDKSNNMHGENIERLCKQLKATEQRFGENSPHLIPVLKALCEHYYISNEQINNPQECILLLRRLVSICSTVNRFRDDKLKYLEESFYCNLLLLDYVQAEECARKVLELIRTQQGKNNRIYVDWLVNFARACRETGKDGESERALIEDLALAEQDCGAKECNVAIMDLASLYVKTGKFGKAEAILTRGYKLLSDRNDESVETGPQLGLDMLRKLADVYRLDQQEAKAEETLRKAMSKSKQLSNQNQREDYFTRSALELVLCLSYQKNFGEAEKTLKLLDEKKLQATEPFYLVCAGIAAQQMGNTPKAEKLFRASGELSDKTSGKYSGGSFQQWCRLATLLMSCKNTKSTEEVLNMLLPRVSKVDTHDYLTEEALMDMAEFYRSLGKFDEAEMLYQKVLRTEEGRKPQNIELLTKIKAGVKGINQAKNGGARSKTQVSLE